MPNTARSSCPEVFCKKDALKKFTKFTGKQPCLPATLLKKRLWKFVKFLRTPFFIEHFRWVLLIKNDRDMTIGIQLK